MSLVEDDADAGHSWPTRAEARVRHADHACRCQGERTLRYCEAHKVPAVSHRHTTTAEGACWLPATDTGRLNSQELTQAGPERWRVPRECHRLEPADAAANLLRELTRREVDSGESPTDGGRESHLSHYAASGRK